MSNTTVGIDIGHETVKIIGLDPAGKRWRLRGMNLVKIPPASWSTDSIKNMDEIAAAIVQGMKTAKPHPINAKRVMFALPESVIFSGTFATTDLPMAELKQALPFEIAEKLSINLEDFDVDYERLTTKCRPIDSQTLASKPENKEKGEVDSVNKEKKDKETEPTVTSPQITVFAVAAKKALIQSLIELSEKAKLDIAGIDIKPGAIARGAVKNDDGRARLIVDMGVGGTSASIAEGKSLRVTSTIPWGTHSIATKITAAVPDLREKAAPVFDELVHVTKFFENRICPGLQIEEVIISGTGANIPNVVEVFQKETGLPTTLAQAFSQIDTRGYKSPEDQTHTFTDAIGLATRGIS